MSDLKLLKKRIYKDERIEEVLDALGCKGVHREAGKVVAALPHGNNKRSVQVRENESLSSHIRSKGIRGISTLLSHISSSDAALSQRSARIYPKLKCGSLMNLVMKMC